MASPMPSPGGGLDPQLMALLQKLYPSLATPTLSGAGSLGQPPGAAAPPGGPGAAGTPPGAPPGPGGAAPGMAGAFGPPTGSPSPGGAPQAPPLPDMNAGSAGGASGGPAKPDFQERSMLATMGQVPFGAEEKALDRQAKIAEELRTTAGPEMRGSAGRGFQTAANPLEFAATLAQRGAGVMKGKDVERQQAVLTDRRLQRLKSDIAGDKDDPYG